MKLNYLKNWKNILIYIIEAIATFVAIFVNKDKLNELATIFSLKGIIAIVILVLFYVHIYSNEKISKSVYISSIFLSCVMITGELLEKYETCFYRNISIILIIISFVGWFTLFENILKIVKRYLCTKFNINIKTIKYINRLNDKSFICICMLIMIICWLPYIILRYPAGIESDAKNQIAQVLGFQKLINRWPVFSSILMGSFFKIGKTFFNSYDLGAIIYVVFQTIISAFVLAYSLNFIRKHKGTNQEILIILITYSFVPLFPGYITSIVKDTLFADMVLLFNILLIEVLIDGNNLKKDIVIGIISLFMCLLRNNGIYILLFESIILAIYMIIKKENYKYLILTFILVVFVNGCYEKIVIPTLGLECDNTVEALSIPLQQTARCVNEHYDELSKEDIVIINKVLNVNVIKEKYNPLSSDPVKETFHGDSGDLLEYFKLWFRMFFKYPTTYVDATLQNIYGFFYPKARMWNRPNCGFYTSNDIAGEYLLSSNEKLKMLCVLFEKYYINSIENLPVIGNVFSIGFYMCTTMVAVIWAICEKKMKYIVYYMPSIVGILVCVAGPTFAQNGARYALPIIYSVPLYIWLYRTEKLSK